VANQRPAPYNSSSAAHESSLAPFDLRIIRAMQLSAARGETAGCVANHASRVRRDGQIWGLDRICLPRADT
jgi:hypothetical protein